MRTGAHIQILLTLQSVVDSVVPFYDTGELRDSPISHPAYGKVVDRPRTQMHTACRSYRDLVCKRLILMSSFVMILLNALCQFTESCENEHND